MAENGTDSYLRFLGGEEAALEELICTYSDALIRFAYCYVGISSVAEDVMEDAMTDVLMKGKHFADEAHFKAYLYKAVQHRSINYLRRHRNHVPLEDVENVMGVQGPEEDSLRKERTQTVFSCIQAMPDQYRQVLTLHYFDGFSVDQISKIMSKNTKQVYNLMSRARIALGKMLEKVGISHEDL